jgi:pimeloyl-ACP methyl ester carboxylesterase
MEKVYFISGLGADKRMFEHLDLSFCNPVFLEWIQPEQKESIESYASRLKQGITEKQPVIVGLSFGGMVAVEIAKQMHVEKLILISSSKTSKEVPPYYRFLQYLPIHRVVPSSFYRSFSLLAYKVLGVENRIDKILVKKMLENADYDFINWSIDTVICWKNKTLVPNTFHIHGTKDIILPYKFIKSHFSVKGGEHLMLITKAMEISKLLKQIINGDKKSEEIQRHDLVQI